MVDDEVITELIALFSGLGSDQFTGVWIDVRDLAVEVNPCCIKDIGIFTIKQIDVWRAIIQGK